MQRYPGVGIGKHLPNALTLLRLLLALPLALAILQRNYPLALAIGLAAGVTDALDGFLARRFDAASRFGAALDPIADKTLITLCFLCFALVDLVPWYLALVVIARDVTIVAGAICYRVLFGPFEFAATWLSKANMFLQILFCLLILLSQVSPDIPGQVSSWGTVLVIVLALASGFDYVLTWTIKALNARKRSEQQ